MKMTFKFSNGRKCWKFAKGVRERKKKWANVDVSRDGTEWMENLLGNLDIFHFFPRFQLLETLFAGDREKIRAISRFRKWKRKLCVIF